MASFHLLDGLVVGAYFAIVLLLGKIGSKHASSGDGFFLAGRKLGKLYQFFLSFGNSADASGAVSTSSVVYQQGVSGVWIGFQAIFINPYYWFMYKWFRRVRLTTMADLFVDRLGSPRLALFYAICQISMAVGVTMGFSNLVSYKISAALVTKPEARWTAAEQQSVAGYHELKQLESLAKTGPLAEADTARLSTLREREAAGELRSYVTAIDPWWFYLSYTIVVGIYIVQGGLAAAALNEAFQGALIVIFSAMLIPAGLAAIGGWGQLATRVPQNMFDLFGTAGASDFTTWSVIAIFVATILQTNALPANMGIGGSARNEFAARFGAVSGTFGKRLTTIMWAFCGLIAIAMYSGGNALADADLVWGTMSRQLLGPGLLGLMLAGVLAAQMSTVAAQAMSASALFARNLYGAFRPGASDQDLVRAGRWALVVVLAIGVLIALQVDSVYGILKFALTMNVPFGAAILLMFIWRRVTTTAIWSAVVGSVLLNIALPFAGQIVPAIATNPTLVARATLADGRPAPVFFESVVRRDPDDPDSELVGSGRLHTELVLLEAVGMDVVGFTPGGRLAGRFFVDAFVPLLLLLGVSLVTRPPEKARIDQFFGRLKTPVGATPDLDHAEVEATRLAPHRFDHRKLFPRSSWEFTRWNREDAIGFVASCAVALAIIGLFMGLLRMAAA